MNVTKDGFMNRQLYMEDYLQRVSVEQNLQKDSLNKAYKKVRSNKGAGGVDGMSVDELSGFLKDEKGDTG